jgi:hypothetical protein
MRIKGKTMPEIADMLNTDRIPTPAIQQKINGSTLSCGAKSDNPLWSANGVGTILNDIRYTGYFVYNMYRADGIGSKTSIKLPMSEWTLVPDAIPAVISKEDYDKVQALKYNRKSKSRKTKNVQAYYEAMALIGSTDNSNIDMNSKNSVKIINKTLKLSEEIRITPDVRLVATVLEDAKYTDEPSLQQLFSQLLKSSVNRKNSKDVHLSFSRLIAEMTSLEAQILLSLRNVQDEQDNHLAYSFYSTGWRWDIYPIILLESNNPMDTYKDMSNAVNCLIQKGLAEIVLCEPIVNFTKLMASDAYKDAMRDTGCSDLQCEIDRLALTQYGWRFMRCMGYNDMAESKNTASWTFRKSERIVEIPESENNRQYIIRHKKQPRESSSRKNEKK